MTINDPDWNPNIMVVGGVYGLYHKDCIQFFLSGSISRGIPRVDWKIPAKDIEAHAFAFCPQANVVVIAEDQNQETPWE
jgi:hypothetical protein